MYKKYLHKTKIDWNVSTKKKTINLKQQRWKCITNVSKSNMIMINDSN